MRLSFQAFALISFLCFAATQDVQATILDSLLLKPSRGPVTIKTSEGTFQEFYPEKKETDIGEEYYELKITDSKRPTRVYRYKKKTASVKENTPEASNESNTRNYEICVHLSETDLLDKENSISKKPDYYVLHFGGIRRRAEQGGNADLLNLLPKQNKYEIWSLNYPGYGESTGPSSLKYMGEAGRAAFDLLKKTADTTPIIISGQSMGTAVALSVASTRPKQVRALILRNVVSIQEILRSNWDRFWNCWGLSSCVTWMGYIPKDLNSIDNAQRIQAPALFLTSEYDNTVPPSSQKIVIENYSGQKAHIILKGIGHEDSFLEESNGEVAQALEQILSQ